MLEGVGFRDHGKNQEFCFGHTNFEIAVRLLCENVKEKVCL